MASHHSGFVSILGRPNVGKSTLMNALLGRKISIVTPQPQTTRNRILGIYDDESYQIIFQDTPGLLAPRDAMHKFMVDEVRRALEGADLFLLMIDAAKGVGQRERHLCELLTPANSKCGRRSAESAFLRPQSPVFILLNKMDLIHPSKVEECLQSVQSLRVPQPTRVITLSALHGTGMGDVLQAVKETLPEGPKYYDPDMLTDRTERFMVEELIREQAFLRVREEVPHALAVQVEEMLDAPERKKVSITANVIVERDTQRAILIGKGGSMIKLIGQDARAEIEKLLGRPVFLSLRVKVLKKWRKGEWTLRELGYHRR
ncbi:MAG: GTPase Era [bacterium]